MRLRSRGLGRKELVLDFREYEIISQGDEVVVVGTIRDPVKWDFTIRICEDDIPGATRLVFARAMLAMLVRSLFKRHKANHWTQERDEHLAEGRRRREATRKTAAERAATALEPIETRRTVHKLRPARPTGTEMRSSVRSAERAAERST